MMTPSGLYPAHTAHTPRATTQVLGYSVQIPNGPYPVAPVCLDSVVPILLANAIFLQIGENTVH